MISIDNAPSLAAHGRQAAGTTPRIVATVRRVSLFGERIVWRTPWRRVAERLNQAGVHALEG